MNTSATIPGPAEVDAAVRAVLGPWLARQRSAHRGPSPGEAGVSDFSGRLLSARLAESFGPAVRVVRIAPGTVVTPLARDHFRRSGVEVRLASVAELHGGARRGEWGFVIETRSGLVEALRRIWLDGPDSWRELPESADAAMEWVAGASDRGALVLTDDAALRVYRACQRAGVRAASARDVDEVARAVRSIGVNLLAVEPSGKPVGLIRQLGAALRRGGAPAAPWEPGNAEGGFP